MITKFYWEGRENNTSQKLEGNFYGMRKEEKPKNEAEQESHVQEIKRTCKIPAFEQKLKEVANLTSLSVPLKIN